MDRITKGSPTEQLLEYLEKIPEKDAQEIAGRILLVAQGMQLQRELEKKRGAVA